MKVILMICTIVAILLLVFVLIRYLSAIARVLVSIGGDGNSYLAKLRLGLRAIEKETGYLPTGVGQLNETLSDAAHGLTAVNGGISSAIDKALKQPKYQ